VTEPLPKAGSFPRSFNPEAELVGSEGNGVAEVLPDPRHGKASGYAVHRSPARYTVAAGVSRPAPEERSPAPKLRGRGFRGR
jgi:hypothetical protein